MKKIFFLIMSITISVLFVKTDKMNKERMSANVIDAQTQVITEDPEQQNLGWYQNWDYTLFDTSNLRYEYQNCNGYYVCWVTGSYTYRRDCVLNQDQGGERCPCLNMSETGIRIISSPIPVF